MDITGASTIARNETILSTDLGGELVMMDLESGEYFNMKDVALRIWELIEEPKTLDLIAETLQSEYKVDPQTCVAETTAFIQQLHDSGVVKVS